MIAYAITDNIYFSNKADMLVYRDKNTKNYTLNAKTFLEHIKNSAKNQNFKKILLHTDYQLAHELQADGIHLKSTQFEDIEKAKALGLFVVISTHSLEEALKAEKLGADMLTFSPIFSTPNKGEPKGLEALAKVVNALCIPVIALGGILTEEQIDLCEQSGAKGFASIRYFL